MAARARKAPMKIQTLRVTGSGRMFIRGRRGHGSIRRARAGCCLVTGIPIINRTFTVPRMIRRFYRFGHFARRDCIIVNRDSLYLSIEVRCSGNLVDHFAELLLAFANPRRLLKFVSAKRNSFLPECLPGISNQSNCVANGEIDDDQLLLRII